VGRPRRGSPSSQLDVIYRYDGEHCACAAGVAGDPVCQHRAVVRFTLGTLPVVVVHIEEMEPEIVPCHSCMHGKVEEFTSGHISGFALCTVCGGAGSVAVVADEPARIAA